MLRTRNVTVFAVPRPRPLVTPPARVLHVGYTSIRLTVPRRGTYNLGVTYAPYWRTTAGCVQSRPNGMMKITVHQPGIVLLRFAVTATSALEAIAGDRTGDCAAP